MTKHINEIIIVEVRYITYYRSVFLKIIMLSVTPEYITRISIADDFVNLCTAIERILTYISHISRDHYRGGDV